MRIYGPNGTTLGSPASNTRRTSSTGFSLPETPAAPEETRSATAPKAAGSIDALLAMQGVEDPTERRKRSVQRGRGALDVLDDLKIGLLSGNLDSLHREPAARCGGQSEILLRRSRPRCRVVRDRASGRGRTGQGRTGLESSDPAPGGRALRRRSAGDAPWVPRGIPWYTRSPGGKFRLGTNRLHRRDFGCTRRRNRTSGPYPQASHGRRLGVSPAPIALPVQGLRAALPWD